MIRIAIEPGQETPLDQSSFLGAKAIKRRCYLLGSSVIIRYPSSSSSSEHHELSSTGSRHALWVN